MSVSPALHRHETASLGARAIRIQGTGAEHARLLRLVLLSYTRWPGAGKQDPWPSNATLAARTGLSERQVERALVVLREAGVATSRVGRRPGARRAVGRLIALELHAPVKALAPEAFDVRNLWAVTRSLRARPAALVTMMTGAYMLACDAAGGALNEWGELGCSMAALRRFVGQGEGSSWARRLRELVQLGLLRREGRRVMVSPPRAWLALVVEAADVRRGIAPAPQSSPARAEPLPTPRRLHRVDELPPLEGREDLASWLALDLQRTGTDDVPLDRGVTPPALRVLRPP